MASISHSTGSFNDQTASGWLVTMLKFASDIEFFAPFQTVKVKMKEIRYSVLQKLQTLMCSIIMGCRYTSDINDKLVPDVVAATMLGMERFPDQSQINVLLRRMSQQNIEQLKHIHATLFSEHSLALSPPDEIVVDIDQSGLIVNGKTYELASKGYFPRRRGEHGYQMSAAYIGGETCETLSLYLDPGNAHCSSRLDDILTDVKERLKTASPNSTKTLRADGGYGSVQGVKNLKATGYHFVVKGCSTQQSRRLADEVPYDAWQEVSKGTYVAEFAGEHSYPDGCRVVLCLVFTKKGERKYSHLVTDMAFDDLDTVGLFNFYNGRQTIEAFMRYCKETYAIKNLRTTKFHGIHAFLWIVFITHNLISLAKRVLFEGTELTRLGVGTIIKKVGSIPAKIQRVKGKLCVIWPETSKLARRIVECLQPRFVQLVLPVDFHSPASRLYKT